MAIFKRLTAMYDNHCNKLAMSWYNCVACVSSGFNCCKIEKQEIFVRKIEAKNVTFVWNAKIVMARTTT
jgi:hypothetical protein